LPVVFLLSLTFTVSLQLVARVANGGFSCHGDGNGKDEAAPTLSSLLTRSTPQFKDLFNAELLRRMSNIRRDSDSN